MPYYRIRTTLSGFVGVKTGKTYHATPSSVIEAPEGEFKTLRRADYSVYEPAASAPDESPAPDPETNE